MMAVKNSKLLEVWSMRLSLGTTLIVVLLSWIKGLLISLLETMSFKTHRNKGPDCLDRLTEI